MKKRRIPIVIPAALVLSCLTSTSLQLAHRRQLLLAFDTANVGALGNNEAFVKELTKSYDANTDYQRINKIQKFLVPLGPIFHYRNNRTFQKIIDIGTEYEGVEITDSVLRDAARRMSIHTLSPL